MPVYNINVFHNINELLGWIRNAHVIYYSITQTGPLCFMLTALT